MVSSLRPKSFHYLNYTFSIFREHKALAYMKSYDNETTKTRPHYEWKVVDAGIYF